MINFCTVEEEIPTQHIHSLIPISSGEERCSPSHAWGAGVRPNYLIHYVISGKGVFYCGQQKFSLQRGQIFVIFPGTIVKYVADEKNPWHYAWVNFAGEEARELLSCLDITETHPYLTLKDGTGALELLRDMPHERGADLCENLRFTARLYEFMSLLTESGESDTRAEKRYLTMATRYITALVAHRHQPKISLCDLQKAPRNLSEGLYRQLSHRARAGISARSGSFDRTGRLLGRLSRSPEFFEDVQAENGDVTE